ncbi:hypothetical protein, partial [Microscilla marina]
MKNGKMIFKGAKRGVISGTKTLDDVAKRLAKKFKIAIKNKRFKLYGEFNPWVLLADGTVTFVDDQTLMRNNPHITNPNRNVLGKNVRATNQKGKTMDGIVVGANDDPSILTKYLQDRSTSQGGRRFNKDLYNNVKSSPNANGTTLNNEFVDLFMNKNSSVRNITASYGDVLSQNDLGQIIRNTLINAGSGPGHLLRDLEKILAHNPQGINHIIGNLRTASRSNFLGAEWVLRYIADGANPQRLRGLTQLEL